MAWVSAWWCWFGWHVCSVSVASFVPIIGEGDLTKATARNVSLFIEYVVPVSQ